MNARHQKRWCDVCTQMVFARGHEHGRALINMTLPVASKPRDVLYSALAYTSHDRLRDWMRAMAERNARVERNTRGK